MEEREVYLRQHPFVSDVMYNSLGPGGISIIVRGYSDSLMLVDLLRDAPFLNEPCYTIYTATRRSTLSDKEFIENLHNNFARKQAAEAQAGTGASTPRA